MPKPRVAEGDERAHVWKRTVEADKPHRDDATSAERRIPVVVLEPPTAD